MKPFLFFYAGLLSVLLPSLTAQAQTNKSFTTDQVRETPSRLFLSPLERLKLNMITPSGQIPAAKVVALPDSLNKVRVNLANDLSAALTAEVNRANAAYKPAGYLPTVNEVAGLNAALNEKSNVGDLLTINGQVAQLQDSLPILARKSELASLVLGNGSDTETAYPKAVTNQLLAQKAGVVETAANLLAKPTLATLASVRSLSVTPASISLTDINAPGDFDYDPTDLVTADDSVLTIVIGTRRYKRRGVSEGLNVRLYGVKGDGTTDDTRALQRALNAAASSRIKVVRVPYGQYVITNTVTIPISVVLEGTSQKPGYKTTYNPDIDNATFVVKTPADTTIPAFVLRYNAGIRNFSFFWPDQLKTLSTPIKYGYAISTVNVASQSDGVLIENITLTNAYNGIKIDFSGQWNCRNISGQAANIGIYLDRAYDVARLENVHFWDFFASGNDPAKAYIQANGRAVVIGDVDGLKASNLFAFGHKHVLHTTSFGTGGPWMQGFNITGDECLQPIYIEKADLLQLTSLNGTVNDKKTGRSFVETGPAVGGEVNLTNLSTYRPQTAINISSATGTFRLNGIAIRKRGDLIFDVNQYKVINQSTAKVYLDEAEFDEVSGNVQVGGQGKWWTSLTDITASLPNFARPHLWPTTSSFATAIPNGTRFDLKGAGLKVVRMPIPAATLYPNSAYVIECDLQLNNPANLNADGQIFLRQTDFSTNDIILPGSNINGFYVNKTHLKVPFVIRRDGLYFDFVFGNNSNAGAISMDVTNLKLSRIEEPALNQSLIDWLHSRQPNALSDPAPNLSMRQHLLISATATVAPDAIGTVTVVSGSPVTISLDNTKAHKRGIIWVRRYDVNQVGAITVSVSSGQIQDTSQTFVGPSMTMPAGARAIGFQFDGTNTHTVISY